MGKGEEIMQCCYERFTLAEKLNMLVAQLKASMLTNTQTPPRNTK